MKFNSNGFVKAIKQARKNRKLTITQAARLRFWSSRYEKDFIALALDCCGGELPQTDNGVDWENFDPENFQAFLTAIQGFLQFIFDLIQDT